MINKDSGVPASPSGSRADASSPQAVSTKGFDPARFEPLPMEIYETLSSDRERSLHAIADCVAYWLKWVTREHEAENIPVNADTHIWNNGYEGAPAHWPSVGQLKRWLAVLRASPELLASAGEAGTATTVEQGVVNEHAVGAQAAGTPDTSNTVGQGEEI